jgi:hypothetical protein
MPYVDLRHVARTQTDNPLVVPVSKSGAGLASSSNSKMTPSRFLVSTSQLEMLKHLGKGVSGHLGVNYEGPYLMIDKPSKKPQNRQYLYLPTMSHKKGKTLAQQATLNWKGVVRGEVKTSYCLYVNATNLYYFFARPNIPAPTNAKVCVPRDQWETFKRAMERYTE